LAAFLKKGESNAVEVTELIGQGYAESLSALENLKMVGLTSRVPGKNYFAFSTGSKISRAVNRDLWRPDVKAWKRFEAWVEKRAFEDLSVEAVTETLYGVVISFCAWCDLYGDPRKVPGTYFERFVANLVGRVLGVNASKSTTSA